MHRLAFFGLWFAESFPGFPSFFDSDNSIVDIVADEMLSPISTKLDDSGSVGRLKAALTSETQSKRFHHCNTDGRCVSHLDAVVAETYYSMQFNCSLSGCRRVSVTFLWDSSHYNVGANTYLI